MMLRSFSTRALVLLLALIVSSISLAKDEKQRDKNSVARLLPFTLTEQLTYEAEFSKLLLRGIKIAELNFTVSRAAPSTTDQIESKQPPIIFVGDVASKGWFRKLFGINFHYRVESTVDPNSLLILCSNKIDEQGGSLRTSETVFNRIENILTWTERDPNNSASQPRVVQAPLQGAAHDIVSAIYFLRTRTLAPGNSFDFIISDSSEVYHIPVKVFAEEKRIKSVIGKVSTVRVDAEIFGEGRPIKGEGRMSIWITKDARRIPVRARISNDYGTLDVTLKKISNGA